jgi:ubiquinone/menaquinone biosynthesis C-methylase UbiE
MAEMLDAELQRETELLQRSWMQHDPAKLRRYLVADVEDPRINIQSILSRHFIVEQLAGPGFAALREHELRFALVMNWLLNLRKASVTQEDLESILLGLRRGADNAEGVRIPGFVSQTFKGLAQATGTWAIPNYFELGFQATERIPEAAALVFQDVWNRVLKEHSSQRISLVEPACGSANDYRFFEAFGLARFLDYTGFDLCEKNVVNAKEMFPHVRFEVANALAPDFADGSFTCAVVHDLFEHLSLPAMERAVHELCRITSQAICVGFFSMHEGKEHVVRHVDDYHWNTLSAWAIKDLFAREGFDVQLIHIDTFLQSCFHFDQAHNENAYTLVARVRQSSGSADVSPARIPEVWNRSAD